MRSATAAKTASKMTNWLGCPLAGFLLPNQIDQNVALPIDQI